MIYRDEVEKVNAIKTLLHYGVLKPVKDMYHGRVGDGSIWQVDPDFNNGGNATGNHNLNKRSGLYVSNANIAECFARKRSYRIGGKPEVQHILPYDNKSLVLSLHAINQLTPEQERICREAIRQLVENNNSHYVNIQFQQRDIVPEVSVLLREFFKKNKSKLPNYAGYGMVDRQTMSMVINYLMGEKVSHRHIEVASKLICARNGIQGLKLMRLTDMSNMFLNHDGDPKKIMADKTISFRCTDGIVHEYPVAESVMRTWLQDNHIVGIEQDVYSATLDEEIVCSSIFDLESVNTQAAVEDKKSALREYYADISKDINSFASETIKTKLQSSPKKLIHFLSEQEPELATAFQGKTGVWEGFTVGEHTETVLEAFNNRFNITNLTSRNVHSFLNLAILFHDIGKATFNDRNDHRKTRELINLACNTMGLTTAARDLLYSLSIDSQQFTTDYYVHKDASALDNLDGFARRVLTDYLGHTPSEQSIKGYSAMARILQTCDSMAYTNFSKTKGTSGEYRNWPSFNTSFAYPDTNREDDLDSKRIRFKNDANDKILG